MARVDNLTNFLTDVAGAIREKKGTSEPILVANFDTEIKSIESGGSSSINAGLIFEEINENSLPVKVKTVGLSKIQGNFFRNVNESLGMFIETTTIIVNKEVTSIGGSAFRECGKLVTLVLPNDEVCYLESKNAFNQNPIETGTGFIYVKDSLVEEYKKATNWIDFATQIKPISDFEGGQL